MLIFPATSLLPSLNTCERIRAQVESHAWTGLLKGRVTVSIGVTQYVLGESVLEFFSRADTAMYMAKEGGRNQVVIDQAIAMRDTADGGLVGPRWPRVPVAAGPDGRANRRPVQMHGAARKPIWPAGR